MNTKKYRWLLYAITLTVITTITVQVYWNYQNYLQNKQRVANEIQLSLDNAVEEYYATLAKKEITTIINYNSEKSDTNFFRSIKFDSIFKQSNKLQKLKSLTSVHLCSSFFKIHKHSLTICIYFKMLSERLTYRSLTT